MNESVGITVQNMCYECMVIERDKTLDESKPCYECQVLAQDKAKGFPVGYCQTCADKAMLKATNYEAGKCATCLKNDEAKADDNAWNLHEDNRLGEGKCLTYDTSAEPSASDWIASVTYINPPRRREQMIEIWDENLKLIQLAVEFIDNDEPTTRSEFLPPIAQLMDGGVYEEYWELDDQRQRAREIECQWCHILTPKAFNDCQDCDKPLELNVR